MAVTAPGTPVPRFRLATEDGGSFTERDLLGERTVLVFYPFAFSPVCTDQLQLYEATLGDLAAQGVTKLYGVSCDSSWSQKAFREKLGVSIEQLSDFEPKGAACKAFGVLHEGGFPERALVAIDGLETPPTLRWSYQAPTPGELPSVELLREGAAVAFGEAAAV
jgi:peroxiredoxin